LNFFPERIVRGPRSAADIAAGFAGPVVGWDGSNINLAGVTTKGWDYRVSYQRRFDNGDLSVTGSWSDPDVTFTKATPAATPSSTFGHQPRRASGSVFWSTGPWDAGVSVNYQTRYFINGLTGAAYPSYWETNPQVSYNFERSGRFEKNADSLWRRTLSGSKLTLTVINAFDNDPDMVDVANGRVVMDPRLRRYIISFSKKL
jgi:iron complex outermembrane recepter protein